ncbi:MAG: phosphoribosylformylglycinamidine synthase, partial [Oscillibacter sp.]|nr:phosphoribosylformylglycinamidine synthase [Oscillibacter sp.]
MVRRVYVEKQPALRLEAQGLLNELRTILGVSALTGLRLVNRYDVENVGAEVFERAKTIVFSEPQVDLLYEDACPVPEGPHSVLAVEALPGQFDQRADSAAQCIQLMAGVDRPLVSYAKVYLLEGTLCAEDMEKIKGYVINPVESREAALEKPETLVRTHAAPSMVEALEGFTALPEADLQELLNKLGLAMDLDDLKFLQNYFKNDEGRDPTLTEVRVVDTYWSDHCRHTTFSTHIDGG